jgi:hypothetical protein
MEGNQKPRKESRIRALFSHRKPASPSPAQPSSSQSSPASPSRSMESADTQKTRNRYNDAVKFLQDTIEARGGERWRDLHLSKFGDEMEHFHDLQLRDQIDETLKILNISIEDQGILGKCRHIIQCMFTALSPLAKNFLAVATTGSNVFSIITLMTFV